MLDGVGFILGAILEAREEVEKGLAKATARAEETGLIQILRKRATLSAAPFYSWMPGSSPRVSGTVCAFMLPSRSLHKHDLPAAAEPLGWRTARSQRCSVVGPVLAVKTLRAAQRLVVDA